MIRGNRNNKLLKRYYRNKGKRYFMGKKQLKGNQEIRLFLTHNNLYYGVKTPHNSPKFNKKMNLKNKGLFYLGG